jgi:hypothetical protein
MEKLALDPPADGNNFLAGLEEVGHDQGSSRG